MIVSVKSNEIKKLTKFANFETHIFVKKAVEVMFEELKNFQEFLNSVNFINNKIDFVFVNSFDLEKLTENERLNFFMDISELGIKVFLNGKISDQSLDMRNLLAKNVLVLEKNLLLEPNLDNMDFMDENIIYEIFEICMPNSQWDLRDCLLYWDISRKEKTVLGKSSYCDSLTLQEALDHEFSIKKFLGEKYLILPFNFLIYEPILKPNLEDVENLLKYKWKIFKLLKDMELKDMEKLPSKIIEFCNSTGFILYKEALPIIKGESKLMKFLKEIE